MVGEKLDYSRQAMEFLTLAYDLFIVIFLKLTCIYPATLYDQGSKVVNFRTRCI